MKRTLILQCPGMVCSPPVVSKCLGEAHRRLELFTLITLFKSFFFPILLVITVGKYKAFPSKYGILVGDWYSQADSALQIIMVLLWVMG